MNTNPSRVKPTPRSLLKLQDDPRVKSVGDESANGNGYWVYLRVGYADLAHDKWDPCHTIHEWTVKDILRRVKDIAPCQCDQCLS